MDKDKRKYVSLEKYRRGPNECQHLVAIDAAVKNYERSK